MNFTWGMGANLRVNCRTAWPRTLNIRPHQIREMLNMAFARYYAIMVKHESSVIEHVDALNRE